MTTPTCPQCGAVLPREGASCARCLLDLAIEPPAREAEEAPASRARRPAKPPPAPAELAPLFPELEIEGLLGAGGMGAVYRAKQKPLGRDVALKVLHAELTGDPVFVERFLREAQALAKLAHPGIVAVHDYGERAGRCYLVMEHVDGANLRVLLRQGLLAPRQALDIVRQLCDALQFAHDEGVVHRDIKPENVLIDAKGRVKVADFGLAKLLGAPASVTLTDVGQVMGTPHYMAPEQLERPRDVDHRADLFSLGVVFYEMLTGELPLGRFAPPSQRVQIDVRLDEIVLKALEHERERRYQHAAQVRTDVESVQRQPARPPPAPPEEDALPLQSGVYVPHLERLLGRERPTAWGWFCLLAAVWCLCAAAFDGGVLGLLLPAALLTWFFVAMVAMRSGVDHGPRRHPPWSVRMDVEPFAVTALGFFALFVAHVATWERWTWGYVSSPQAPGAGLERWRGAEPELLRMVGITAESRPELALSDLRLELSSSHSVSNPYALFELQPLLSFAAAGALFLLAAWLTARKSARPAGARRRGVASSLALLLGSLAAVHVLAFAIQGGSQKLVAVSVARECRGDAHELGQELYQALVARELEVHAEHSARVVDRRSGSTLAEVHLLAAGPASPFARWQMTWAGPVRTQPHVLFTLVSDTRGERAVLLADGGLGEPETIEQRGWSSQIQELVGEACLAQESK